MALVYTPGSLTISGLPSGTEHIEVDIYAGYNYGYYMIDAPNDPVIQAISSHDIDAYDGYVYFSTYYYDTDWNPLGGESLPVVDVWGDRPANDTSANASTITLNASGGTFTGTNYHSQATGESGEYPSEIDGSGNYDPDVYYKFVSPITGKVVFETGSAATSMKGGLSWYPLPNWVSGPSLEVNNWKFHMNVVKGTTYTIGIGAQPDLVTYDPQWGDFTITYSFLPVKGLVCAFRADNAAWASNIYWDAGAGRYRSGAIDSYIDNPIVNGAVCATPDNNWLFGCAEMPTSVYGTGSRYVMKDLATGEVKVLHQYIDTLDRAVSYMVAAFDDYAWFGRTYYGTDANIYSVSAIIANSYSIAGLTPISFGINQGTYCQSTTKLYVISQTGGGNQTNLTVTEYDSSGTLVDTHNMTLPIAVQLVGGPFVCNPSGSRFAVSVSDGISWTSVAFIDGTDWTAFVHATAIQANMGIAVNNTGAKLFAVDNSSGQKLSVYDITDITTPSRTVNSSVPQNTVGGYTSVIWAYDRQNGHIVFFNSGGGHIEVWGESGVYTADYATAETSHWSSSLHDETRTTEHEAFGYAGSNLLAKSVLWPSGGGGGSDSESGSGSGSGGSGTSSGSNSSSHHSSGSHTGGGTGTGGTGTTGGHTGSTSSGTTDTASSDHTSGTSHSGGTTSGTSNTSSDSSSNSSSSSAGTPAWYCVSR